MDDWAIKELTPPLQAEIRELQSAHAVNADREALAELQRKLKEVRDRETRKLTLLIDSMDADQFAAVANQLRVEREGLQRHIAEIEARLRQVEEDKSAILRF